MKLEKRSPAIAAPATNAPTFHGSPSSSAASGVASSETATPRMVFVGPNGGRPSAKIGSPVEWSVEARAERPFGEHGGAVGDDDQQDELGD